MILTKKYWILIGVVVLAILLGGTLIYLSWSRQKSEPSTSQSDQIKSELIRKVLIPSSLEPFEVMQQFVPHIPPGGERVTKNDFLFYFNATSNQGFAKGFSVIWHGELYWVKKGGTKVYGPDDPYGFILDLVVLKYEDSESAREDYDKISAKQEFSDTVFKGVELRTKSGISLAMERWGQELPMPEQQECQQYLLKSNNFIIYTFGLKEATEDVIMRVIDQYAVE